MDDRKMTVLRGGPDGKPTEEVLSETELRHRLGQKFTERANGQTHDPVNWPAHYIGQGGLQTIDVIEDWGLGFHLGNALKYILRAQKKGNRIQDCAKSIWYLERAQGAHITETLAIDNTPFVITTLQVDVAFDVPRGALRDAVDDIHAIALMRQPDARRLRLAATVRALQRWIAVTTREAAE